MSHLENNKKVISRIHRIQGQLNSVEKSIINKKDCFDILQTLSACKGAMNGLINDLIESHITEHIIANKNESIKNQAAKELIKLLKTYTK